MGRRPRRVLAHCPRRRQVLAPRQPRQLFSRQNCRGAQPRWMPGGRRVGRLYEHVCCAVKSA